MTILECWPTRSCNSLTSLPSAFAKATADRPELREVPYAGPRVAERENLKSNGLRFAGPFDRIADRLRHLPRLADSGASEPERQNSDVCLRDGVARRLAQRLQRFEGVVAQV